MYRKDSSLEVVFMAVSSNMWHMTGELSQAGIKDQDRMGGVGWGGVGFTLKGEQSSHP